jgi:hypothetical protein
MLRNSIRSMLAFVLVVLTYTSAVAQPLTGRVPDGAWLYVGWAGAEADETLDAYRQSTLKAMVDEMRPEQMAVAVDRLIVGLKALSDDPQVDEVIQQVTAVAGPLAASSWSSPMAMCILPPSGVGSGGDFPGGMIMWQPTEAERPALLQTLLTLESALPKEAMVTVAADERVLTLAVNGPPMSSDLLPNGDLPVSLSVSPTLSKSLKQVGGSDLLTIYADLPALTNWTKTLLDDPDTPPEVFAVWDALNIEGIGAVAITSGFNGKDWSTRAFLSAPAPRTGLMSLLETPAVEDEHLALIPKDATFASVSSFDLGKLIDVAREVSQALGPDVEDQFETGLAMGSGMLGVNLEDGFLRGLGPIWMVYTSPDVMGESAMGGVLVNPLADADSVEQALRTLQAVGNVGLMQAQQSDPNIPVRIQFHPVQYGEVIINQLGIPLFTPSWAIHDGKLYAAMYPQAILAAIDRNGEGPSLLDNEKFVAMRKALAPGRITGVTFTDLPATLPNNYGSLIMIESLLFGGGSMFTGQPMPSFVPPLSRIRPHVRPIAATAWIDEHGVHSRSSSPFPGASLFASQSSGLSSSMPLFLGGFVEGLEEARRTSRRMQRERAWREADEMPEIEIEAVEARPPIIKVQEQPDVEVEMVEEAEEVPTVEVE